MGWFDRFKKSKEPEKPKGPKTYTFSTTEICSIGDKYEYKIKASSKREAFNLLIQYFYGEKYPGEGVVESKHYNVTQPQKDVFTYHGMPGWFARRISGWVRNDYTDFQKKLEQYAFENNIKLKQD